MGKIFGTDGVRGLYDKELSLDLAYRLGQAGAKVLGNSHQPKIVIGMDTRYSCQFLEKALIEGILSVGGEAVSVGVMPTPAVAVITRQIEADAGIVISASHNPYEYNGIKFFNHQGFKLPDAVEDQIESLIFEGSLLSEEKTGKHWVLDCPEAYYLSHIKESVKTDLKGLKIVLDCANGAAAFIGPAFFESLGAEVLAIGVNPDGKNINKDVGSTYLRPLQKAVVEARADIGIAMDGDADRCLAVDNAGNIIDGDQILNLIAREMMALGRLKHNTAVVTVMSNIGLDLALKEIGCQTVKTDVGDRYVLETMQAGGYNLGGEQSGHLILLDYNTTGDGMLTALVLLDLIKKDKRDMKKLGELMTIYPQILVNARVPNERKTDYLKDLEIIKQIEKLEKHFSGKGRVLIRPSGTEPLVRVMIEGENQDELSQMAQELASLIEERLNNEGKNQRRKLCAE